MLGNKCKQFRIDLFRGFLLNCSTCYIAATTAHNA